MTEGMWYKSDVELLTATVRAVKSASEPYTLVTLAGEADVTNHDQLRAVLAAQVAKSPRTLIVDLAGLEFMDSSALHEILRASRAMDTHGGVFALAAPRDADEIVCEVRDAGVIADPLAGRRTPVPGALNGHGLWLVYQVCDRVELLSGADGTLVRMHMQVGDRD